jgi:hypothetical protein
VRRVLAVIALTVPAAVVATAALAGGAPTVSVEVDTERTLAVRGDLGHD